MDVRIRILFLILLLWRIVVFFQNRERNLDNEIEELEDRLKFLPSEIQGVILGITKIFAVIIIGINVLLLTFSLKVVDGWLHLIPIISFMILNFDLTIFFCSTLKEYLHRGNHKWVKPLRVWYLAAAMIWFGLMVVIRY